MEGHTTDSISLRKRISAALRRHRYLEVIVKATGITLLAMLLSTCLVSPFTASTSLFFSSPEQKDFQFSDIFAQIANNRPVRQFEDRVVILDIGNSNRQEIAEGLTMLSLCSPRAVGIDIMFGLPGEDDEPLIEALTSLSGATGGRVVLPRVVAADTLASGRFTVSERSFLEDILPREDFKYAATNLPTKSQDGHGRVREYAIDFPVSGEEEAFSFPVLMARITDTQAYDRLMKRNATAGIIDYPSREIPILTISDIPDNMEMLKDKTVIIGSLSDAYDMHATPVNSYFPGVKIHALALATILDGTWFSTLPPWVDYLTAFIVCFIIVTLCLTLWTGIKAMIIRILQIALLYIAVRIGYSLYLDHQVICNFSRTLLIIAFGLFAIDLWNGVVFLLSGARNKILRITSSHKETEQCEELS